jgi:hypothetical protein
MNNRIEPQVFSIERKKYTFKGKVLLPAALRVKDGERETLNMKALQLPVLVNNATTGHKLQGSGVVDLFVHNWSYTKNWAYVMLSRVKTRAGLFCRKKLSKDLKKYAVPPALLRMLDGFRNRCSPSYWEDSDYDDLFDNE